MERKHYNFKIWSGILIFFLAFALYSEDKGFASDKLLAWRRQLSQVIISPIAVSRFGHDDFLRKENNLTEKDIAWIKDCKSEELFIYQLKKIIDYTKLDIPVFVSPDAALVTISYPGADTVVLMPYSHRIDLGALFEFYKEMCGIDYSITETGLVFTKIPGVKPIIWNKVEEVEEVEGEAGGE